MASEVTYCSTAVQVTDVDSMIESPPPQTFLRSVVEKCSGEKALAVKREGRWEEWSYAEYLETVRDVAKGFLALGLGRQRGVGIMGLNTPETVFSILGSVFAGGLSAGIYRIVHDA